MTGEPGSAIIMARISDARNGITAGVDDQLSDLRRHAAKLVWTVGKVIVENDVSAFKRRRVLLPDGRTELRVWRPDYREALDDLYQGRHDGLIVIDLDRTTRDPRDLEDLIDVIESRTPRIPVASISGSLDLGTDAGVTMARVMCALANKSSRDTARRVARARLRQAEEGRFGGGRRRYGYAPDGTTVIPEEATEIRDAADAILAGASLRMLAADLRRRNIPTPDSAQWSSAGLRSILTRPSIAGLVIHRGQILEGVKAAWEPILPRDQWEAMTSVLKDPGRRVGPGNTPRWLGSGIYLCGHPDCAGRDPRPTMVVHGHTNGYPAYQCARIAHLSRKAVLVDDWVERAVIRILAATGAADLARPGRGVDVRALAVESAQLRARIAEAGDLWEEGVIDAGEYRVRKTRLTERMAAVDARARDAAGDGALAGLVGSHPGMMWEDLDLGRRRAVLRILAVVTVLPATRQGCRGFDPDLVTVAPLLRR